MLAFFSGLSGVPVVKMNDCDNDGGGVSECAWYCVVKADAEEELSLEMTRWRGGGRTWEMLEPWRGRRGEEVVHSVVVGSK